MAKSRKEASSEEIELAYEAAPAGHSRGSSRPALFSFLDMLYINAFNFFRMVGLFFKTFLRGVRKSFVRFYEHHLETQFDHLGESCGRVTLAFTRFRKRLTYRFHSFFHFFTEAGQVVRAGFRSHPEKSGIVRVGYAFRAFFQGVRNNARIFLTLLNYTVPVVSLFLLAQLVTYVLNLPYAVSVEYNGAQIGYIQTEAIYNKAEGSLQKRIRYQTDEEALTAVPKFEVTIVSPDELTTKPITLADAMLKNSNKNIVQAIGVSVDGQFFGAVQNDTGIRDTLSSILAEYEDDENADPPSFTKEVTLDSGLYLQSNLRDETEIISTLSQKESRSTYDSVRSGDTPATLAERNDMTVEELGSLNPNLNDSFRVGQTITVTVAKPFLPVKCTRLETYSLAIPFATHRNPTNTLYEGMETPVLPGENGEKSETAKVAYVDGVEVSREVVSTIIVREPITKQISYGTMPMPMMGSNLGATSGFGLIRPVSASYHLSQVYGWNPYDPNHRGIDIACSYGTPIYSVLPGTVTFAGYDGTFGRIVRIKHASTGFETWYAHCSQLNVSVGQTVAQGQVIGFIGMTGRATGNHCHFELYYGGARQNPLKYLPPM